MQSEPGSQNTSSDPRAQPSATPQTPAWQYPSLRDPSLRADTPPGTQPPLIPYYPTARPPIPGPHPRRRHGIPWYVWLVGGCLGVLAIGTLAIAVVMGLVAGMALHVANSHLSPAPSTTLSKRFPVSGAPTITIIDPSGAITIHQGSDSTVAMQATIYAQNLVTTQENATGVAVTSTQHGNAIDITVTINPDSSFFVGKHHVDLDLTIPRQSTLQMTLLAGDISVSHISGLLVTHVAAGNTVVSGGSLATGSHLGTDVGNIAYAGALAPGADVTFVAHTGAVTLTLPPSTAATIDASTSVGNINISGWGLSPNSEAMTGQTLAGTLGSSPNGAIHVSVDTGNITVRQG